MHLVIAVYSSQTVVVIKRNCDCSISCPHFHVVLCYVKKTAIFGDLSHVGSKCPYDALGSWLALFVTCS